MDANSYENAFLSFRNELSSFIFRMVSNRQDTEDIVQDTYIKALAAIDSFQHKSSFKTWVFSIAVNLAKNHLKKQQRWVESAQDHGANLHLESQEHTSKLMTVFYTRPDLEFEVKEHISYCFNCMAKTLELHQQLCLWLKEVYEFKVSEIMEITGLSEGKVKHALVDARKNMIRIFDNRCAFINKKGTCHQCTALKGVLNPEQDAHIKAKNLQLVKEGASQDKEYLLDLRVQLAKGMDPLNSSNTHLHAYFLESLPEWVEIRTSRLSE